jgi:hypothetical protein
MRCEEDAVCKGVIASIETDQEGARHTTEITFNCSIVCPLAFWRIIEAGATMD